MIINSFYYKLKRAIRELPLLICYDIIGACRADGVRIKIKGRIVPAFYYDVFKIR